MPKTKSSKAKKNIKKLFLKKKHKTPHVSNPKTMINITFRYHNYVILILGSNSELVTI